MKRYIRCSEKSHVPNLSQYTKLSDSTKNTILNLFDEVLEVNDGVTTLLGYTEDADADMFELGMDIGDTYRDDDSYYEASESEYFYTWGYNDSELIVCTSDPCGYHSGELRLYICPNVSKYRKIKSEWKRIYKTEPDF